MMFPEQFVDRVNKCINISFGLCSSSKIMERELFSFDKVKRLFYILVFEEQTFFLLYIV